MTAFPKILTQLRESRHLKKKELAAELHLSASMISQYESGRCMPSYEVLLDFAKFFGVSTDYLLGVSLSGDLEKKLSQIYCQGKTATDVLSMCLDVPVGHRATVLDVLQALGKQSRKEPG